MREGLPLTTAARRRSQHEGKSSSDLPYIRKLTAVNNYVDREREYRAASADAKSTRPPPLSFCRSRLLTLVEVGLGLGLSWVGVNVGG